MKLHDLIKFMRQHAADHGHPIDPRAWAEIEQAVRRAHPAERVYIPPADSKKDPARADAIREAAITLPTSVVAERFGVTRAWVYRIVKGGRK